MGCHITLEWSDGAFGRCVSGLWGRGRAEVAHAGDGTDRLVDLRRPVAPLGVACDLVGCACWYWYSLISSLLSNPLVFCFFSPGAPFILLPPLLFLILPSFRTPLVLFVIRPLRVAPFDCRWRDDRREACGCGATRIRGGGLECGGCGCVSRYSNGCSGGCDWLDPRLGQNGCSQDCSVVFVLVRDFRSLPGHFSPEIRCSCSWVDRIVSSCRN
jgi:hypothetical protein